MLVQEYLGNYIPTQLDFWKENGEWRSHHPLTQHDIYQFGTYIENHLIELELEHLKTIAV
jgi:hypothetical protein